MEKNDIDAIITEMVSLSDEEYNGHSFAAGYLTSFSTTILMELPPKKRKIFIEQIKSQIESLKLNFDQRINNV